MGPETCAVAVDLVVLTVRNGVFCALVVRRGSPPFLGRLALPGGFILPDEDLAAAAIRELREETGIADVTGHIEQLATYGHPDRDPRGRVITVAYLALVPDLPEPTPGSDAAEASWRPAEELLGAPAELAFDHHTILIDGVERARAKLEYAPVGTAFCPAAFTISELRQVYEAVWGGALDPRNFHRKITTTTGFLEPTDERTTRQGGRPASLYRAGTARLLHPPMLRPEHRPDRPGGPPAGGPTPEHSGPSR
jgi:8-oxo-dGTP diphosphatase